MSSGIKFGSDASASVRAAPAHPMDIVFDSTALDTRAAAKNAPRPRKRRGLIDGTELTDSSGDSWELQLKRKKHFDCGEGKFVVTFTELHKLMIQRKITGEVRRVLDWLCLNIKADNLVSGFTQRRVANDLGIAQTNVSKALVILIQEDIAQRGKTGEIFLNPRYLFTGSVNKQRMAAKEWDKARSERRRTEMIADAAPTKSA